MSYGHDLNGWGISRWSTAEGYLLTGVPGCVENAMTVRSRTVANAKTRSRPVNSIKLKSLREAATSGHLI